MKKEAKKRTLSALLCVTMVVSLYSTFTFADDVDGETLGNGDGYTTEQNGGDSSQDTLGGGSASDDGDGGVNLCGEDGKDEGKDNEGGDDASEDSEDITYENFTFNTSTGTITGVTDKTVTTVSIPDEIEGVKVVAIGDSAFYDCAKLTSITIPDSVETIGSSAFFSCDVLSSVTIPSSVKTIGNNAFWLCENLSSVTLQDGLTTIGDRAFFQCGKLKKIEIPDSVTTIGEGAFRDCSLVDGIKFPEGITTISKSMFSGCDFTTIEIPDTVTSIGEGAFSWCYDLTSITIPGNVTEVGAKVFYNDSGLLNVTFENGVKKIGSSAFIYCKNLQSVTFADSITEIGSGAFEQCAKLAEITIPRSVTTIGNSAFSGCDSLTSVTIPNTAKKIGTSLFSSCDSLKSVIIEDGVTEIGDFWFYACDSLTSIEIPGSVTRIGNDAFRVCTSLTELTIPEGVTTIGSEAFMYCDNMTSLTIPDSVTSIGYNACYDWRRQANIYISKENGSLSGAPWGARSNITTTHWQGGTPTIKYDTKNYVLTGFTAGETYTINGKEVTLTDDSKFAIEDDWYGKTISIQRLASDNYDYNGQPSEVQTLEIPAISAAPAGVGVVGTTGKDKADGQLTGVSSAMEYKASDATGWTACYGNTVSGLAAGTYQVRTKATATSFASEPVTKVIGLEYETTVDDLKIDIDSDAITGLVPGKDYVINGETVTATSEGSIDIDDSWYGTDITITEKGTSTGAEGDAMTITVPAKAEKPTGVTFVNESKAGAGDGKITGVSTDMEYRVNGAAIWTPCTGDTVTGLAPGKYEVRIKSINGKFASDPVSGTVGTTVSGDTTGGAGGSGSSGGSGSGSGSDTTPVNPDPVTPVNPDPVTPVNPDPVTPVNPDPVTPVNPDQGGTDQGNGGNAGNGGSTSGTSGSYSSGSDDDDDDSYSINNNKKPGSQSGSTTNGTTNGSAANAGSQNASGTTTNGQNNGSTTGNTTATITNGSGISQTVKDNLSNALDSILEMDGNIQTGPYVRSDSDDISVQIPNSLQKSGRNFYLMTAKDNGDIVVLPNDSTEDDMFEADGEADTDYQMLFEDGDTPLASMITESGVLDTSAAAGCINHGVGLGLALIGLAAAALLARMGKKYFWAASAAGIVLALIAAATGSCHLDWICFAGEAVVTVAATAALMLKKANVKEQ